MSCDYLDTPRCPRAGCLHPHGECLMAKQTPQQFVKAALAAEREQWTGPQVVRCDFGGTCNREHGAQCAAVCRRMRGEA